VDTDTVRSIVRTLPPRMCLALGHAVSNLPILVNVDAFDSPPTGLTRLFFQDEKDAVSVSAVRGRRNPEP
jgi:hypothetical protein